ncbi:ROK family protein [Aureimonas jatrophae]|uniref:Glucokinase n=1 Tax=Aureimonas jatrophae TaxID=1166073 RepID=A0A1H0HTD3_9HYPH|nr:ROK family protein [Aureimonas jatrophae]MBB3950768.1 glucokinase [Aureimonas jatrophae]SDO22462.1 glucokinase [Aureimonas jatrophae]
MRQDSAIGIDIGGTHLRAARVAPDGAIEARARASSDRDPAVVVERIAHLIEAVDQPGVVRIGIGVPGRVDFASGRVLSGGYVDLSGTDLRGLLEARFGRPVVVDNDCSMALVAESAVGAARGRHSAVMLTIGTGIGGAVMDEGRIVRGRGAAGQLGHVGVDPAGRPCLCGRRGCVETVSSGTALGVHIREAGLPPETTAAELLGRRADGDAKARAVLMSWAGPLRLAIDSLVAVHDPEVVVLGGGLGAAAAAALDGIEVPASWYHSPVVPAQLGDDAGVIGAALLLPPGTRNGGKKRVVLVNGVPASGKSTVAQAISQAAGWPLLSLDTVKTPFLDEIEGVDRPFNRRLGRASLRALFELVREAPAGTGVVIDAWFGFQPHAFTAELLALSGADEFAEVWCTAPPEVIGERYLARVGSRSAAHPGAEYVPELVALARRAEPLRFGPVVEVDTRAPADPDALWREVADRWTAPVRHHQHQGEEASSP